MAERSSFSTDARALLGALITVAILLVAAYFGVTLLGSSQASSPSETDTPTLVPYEPSADNASAGEPSGAATPEENMPAENDTTAGNTAGEEQTGGSDAEAGSGSGPGAQAGMGEPNEISPNALDADAMATAVAQGTEFPDRSGSGSRAEGGAQAGMDVEARMTAIAQGTLAPGSRPGAGGNANRPSTEATPSAATEPSMQAEPTVSGVASTGGTGAAENSAPTTSIPAGSRLFGVARGSGATLYETLDGAVLVDLTAGTSVSGIARTADGNWILLQVGDAVGWAPLNQLVMYGAENLPVFQGELAQSGSADMGGQSEAPAAEPSTAPEESTQTAPVEGGETAQNAEAAPTTEQVRIKPIVGTVDSRFNRLNVRSGPGTNYDIVERLNPGSEVVSIGRTSDSEWLQLSLPDTADGTGWVAAEYVSLGGAEDELPVVDNSQPETPLFLLPTPTPSQSSDAQSLLAPTPAAEIPSPTPVPQPTATMAEDESTESNTADAGSAATPADALTLYSEPSAESEVVKVLEPGLELLELERNDDGTWARVAVLDPPGGVGWVNVAMAGLEPPATPSGSEPEPTLEPPATSSEFVPEPTPEPPATPSASEPEPTLAPSAETSNEVDAQLASDQDTSMPTEEPAATASMTEPSDAIPAVVISEDSRLNIREQPDTTSDIVTKVDPGDVLDALAVNLAGDWIQVSLPGADGMTGWVAAEFVDLGDQADALQVIIPDVTIDRTQSPLVAVSAEPVSQPDAIATDTVDEDMLEAPKYLPVVGAPSESVTAGDLSGVLVFVAIGGGSIYGYDLGAGTLWPITTGFDPAISPDGSTVAFTRDGGEKGLYLINTHGSNERLIFSGNQRLASPKWSPDGQWIAFSFGYDTDRCYLIGGNCISVDEWGDRKVPDGVTLTTLVNYHIGVVDRDGQNYHELSTLNYARTPDWNDSGVVYESNSGLQLTADENGATSQQIIFDPLKPFFSDPDWQPNGSKIIYMGKEASHWELFSVNPDGTGVVPLTRPATALVDEIPSNVSPTWSPDGTRIIFLSNRTDSGEAGAWRLWIMDADGGNQRPLDIGIPLNYSFGDEQVVSWAQ